MNGRMLNVQGASVYLMEHGTGMPTLCLHGNPDSADMWNDVVTRLPQYRSLAPDLPGYGRSASVPHFDTSLDHSARWVEELVNAAGIREPLNLVMHDFGGHFGLAWAIRHPDRVRRMAIFNTSFFSDYEWHPLAKILRTPVLGELGLWRFNEAQYVRQLQKDAPRVPRAYIHRAMQLYTAPARKMTLRLYRGGDSSKFIGWEDELCGLTARVPTVVLWGDRDPYAPVQWAERFGAEMVYHFPENSHWLPVEAPEEVAQKLGQFFGPA